MPVFKSLEELMNSPLKFATYMMHAQRDKPLKIGIDWAKGRDTMTGLKSGGHDMADAIVTAHMDDKYNNNALITKAFYNREVSTTTAYNEAISPFTFPDGKERPNLTAIKFESMKKSLGNLTDSIPEGKYKHSRNNRRINVVSTPKYGHNHFKELFLKSVEDKTFISRDTQLGLPYPRAIS